MELYAAIDLHSNNSFLVVINEKDEPLYEKRLPNDLETIIKILEPYKRRVTGIAIESTYNWYWLVDGLMEAGFLIHLVNTTAAKQYDGLKFADDKHDARWLAHLLRLNILPTGYIYPKEQRALRDLLRDRMRLVQQRTTHLVSIHCRLARLTGHSFSCDHISRMTPDRFAKQVPNNNNCMALVAHHAVAFELSKAITQIEECLLAQIKTQDCYQRLRTITGIGPILGMMIFLETISRALRRRVITLPIAGALLPFVKAMARSKGTEIEKMAIVI